MRKCVADAPRVALVICCILQRVDVNTSCHTVIKFSNKARNPCVYDVCFIHSICYRIQLKQVLYFLHLLVIVWIIHHVDAWTESRERKEKLARHHVWWLLHWHCHIGKETLARHLVWWLLHWRCHIGTETLARHHVWWLLHWRCHIGTETLARHHVWWLLHWCCHIGKETLARHHVWWLLHWRCLTGALVVTVSAGGSFGYYHWD